VDVRSLVAGGSLRGRERRVKVVSAQRTGDGCREKDRMEVRRERFGGKRSRWMVGNAQGRREYSYEKVGPV
jgi:hypothetical protein